MKVREGSEEATHSGRRVTREDHGDVLETVRGENRFGVVPTVSFKSVPTLVAKGDNKKI